MATVKSTINLNKYYKEQLELFVQMNRISSVTEGINTALENYVKTMQKTIYSEQMKAAAADKNFMERTMASQRDFEQIDSQEIAAEADEW